MATWEIIALVIAGLFALVVLAIFGRFAGLWVQSIVSGAPVGLLDLFMMRLRKVSPGVVVSNRITAKKAGLDLSAAQLEAHYLAGGTVERVGAVSWAEGFEDEPLVIDTSILSIFRKRSKVQADEIWHLEKNVFL